MDDRSLSRLRDNQCRVPQLAFRSPLRPTRVGRVLPKNILMNKIIHVAAGVIVNTEGQILIARRSDCAHQGGLWEFPGGKLEAGETVRQALVRELDEELGIVSRSLERLIQIRHDYPDKSILLEVWRVTEFDGEAHGREGQPIVWVAPEELDDYEFPAANVPIITAVQLPPRMLVTGSEASVELCVTKIQKALDNGIRLIQLRQKTWTPDQWAAGVPKALQLCRAASAGLILNSPLGNFNADGVHLTSQQLMSGELPVKTKRQWLSASCHNEAQLAQAEALGVDFVTLSPVETTTSHPGDSALGWSQFSSWVDRAKLPVFALGGMSNERLERAVESGAQGVAGISAWWPS